MCQWEILGLFLIVAPGIIDALNLRSNSNKCGTWKNKWCSVPIALLLINGAPGSQEVRCTISLIAINGDRFQYKNRLLVLAVQMSFCG